MHSSLYLLLILYLFIVLLYLISYLMLYLNLAAIASVIDSWMEVIEGTSSWVKLQLKVLCKLISGLALLLPNSSATRRTAQITILEYWRGCMQPREILLGKIIRIFHSRLTWQSKKESSLYHRQISNCCSRSSAQNYWAFTNSSMPSWIETWCKIIISWC